jgi:chromosome segregation ATPase
VERSALACEELRSELQGQAERAEQLEQQAAERLEQLLSAQAQMEELRHSFRLSEEQWTMSMQSTHSDHARVLQECATLRATLELCEAGSLEARSLLKAAQHEAAELQQRENELVHQIEHMNQVTKQLTVDRAAASREMALSSKLVAVNETRLSEREVELSDLHSQCAALSEECIALRTNVDLTTQALASAQALVARSELEVKQLGAECCQMKQELQDSDAAKLESGKRLRDAQNECQLAQHTLSLLQQQVDDLQVKMDTECENNSVLRNEMTMLRRSRELLLEALTATRLHVNLALQSTQQLRGCIHLDNESQIEMGAQLKHACESEIELKRQLTTAQVVLHDQNCDYIDYNVCMFAAYD